MATSSQKVLFMCPHSAGKSLAAATYFRAAAHRIGLHVDIAVAGPDPDETNMTNVVGALTDQGYRIDWQPRLVTERDTAEAAHLISIGCDHDTIPTSAEITEWDVPLISQDLAGSLQAIHDRCEGLARELSQASPSGSPT